MDHKEIVQKNAALWMHYSNLSMSMNGKNALFDNGARIAGVDVSLKYSRHDHKTGTDKNKLDDIGKPADC